MDDLTEFVKARLDEDEATAKAAESAAWHWEHGYGEMCNDPECAFGQLVADTDPAPTVLMDVHGYDVHLPWQGAAHIARHDPARVLREVAAKRAILTEHAQLNDSIWCRTCDPAGESGDSSAWYPCKTVRILAATWSDHLGYRQEWKP